MSVNSDSIQQHYTHQVRNHGWKVERGQGATRPASGRAGGECVRVSPPPAVRVWGYYPRKIFENLDAKSCILVASALIIVGSCCEISYFLKTTAKKLGYQYIVGPPT